MSVGLGFIRQLLTDKPTFSFLDTYGLCIDDFTDEERPIVTAITHHLITYEAFPALAVIEVEHDMKFPEFPDQPVQYWVDRIIKRTNNRTLLEAAKKISEKVMEGDDDAAYSIMQDAYSTASVRKKGRLVVSLSELAGKVLEEHDENAVVEGRPGVPFGFPYVDSITGGAQGGDLVSIVARTNVGKTYTLLKMSNTAYEQGYTPMVVSTEMLPVQYARRILALMSHVPADRIRLGGLSSHLGRKRLQEEIHKLEGLERPYYIMRSSLSSTLNEVILQIKEKNPDCIYIDGAYLLTNSGKKTSRFEQVSSGVETLKLLAQEVGKPVVATYQMGNKKGGFGLESVYMSDIIVQISSIVFGLKNDEEENNSDVDRRVISRTSYKIMSLLKGREGEKGAIRILFDMMRMRIEEIEVLSAMEDRS